MGGIVMVFNFDKAIIDCDSDNCVVDDLGMTDLFNKLLPTLSWNKQIVNDLKIVSDVNTFFIETILDHGRPGYFSKIHTNPSFIDEEGTLTLSPYHEKFTTHPHGWGELYAPNMCKVETSIFVISFITCLEYVSGLSRGYSSSKGAYETTTLALNMYVGFVPLRSNTLAH
ncbi:hypothetical protein GIB67_029400 [Kingdonia uniflora]|uniref:Uncharacterized protein n=1 Tax=Kingdonia uniflora TaxID=39325 RepID=A0A7J7NYC0_9MAGN|nr:hypothetical protein GIB67_029400 [Kingdonia uniflora]